MLKLEGQLTVRNAVAVGRQLETLLRAGPQLEVDLGAVTAVDSAGAAVLVAYARRARAQGGALRLSGATGQVARTLQLLPFPPATEVASAPSPSFFEAWGDRGLYVWRWTLQYLMLCADLLWFGVAGLWRRDGIRWRAVVYEMAMMGSRALGVVGLISFLVGGTMALQAAAQLRRFGANIFVVDLVSVSITRELGPLMTAIVLAGRTGSAVAAELGTMVITEEIDALRTMGINPVRFLVLPKVVAIILVLPVLTVLADALAIGGGMVVGTTYLDIAPDAFVGRLQEALFLKDLVTGLVKSLLFAVIIVSVGAMYGMRTQGGADSVGRSTTASVVTGIFAVIVADAACSLLFYFGG